MTISDTLHKFDELKVAILKDGKIDYDEAEVLDYFISDYVRAGNKNFVELHKALVKAMNDKVISDDESKALICKIDAVSEFLKKEKKIETALAWISGISLLVFAALHFL